MNATILKNCAATAVLIAVGCQGSPGDAPQRAAVTGTVTVDKTPLERGTIRFVPVAPTTGPTASANIEDGLYELPRTIGPVVGTHRVEIDAIDPEGFAPDDEEARAKWVAMGQPKLKAMHLPPEFNQRSTLRATIDDIDRNWVEFDLTTRRDPRSRDTSATPGSLY